MSRWSVAALFALTVLAPLPAQHNARRARIKKVDADNLVITLTVDGKDQDFAVTESTRMPNVPGKDVKDKLRSKELKEGAEVRFLAATREGKAVLQGMLLEGRG